MITPFCACSSRMCSVHREITLSKDKILCRYTGVPFWLGWYLAVFLPIRICISGVEAILPKLFSAHALVQILMLYDVEVLLLNFFLGCYSISVMNASLLVYLFIYLPTYLF